MSEIYRVSPNDSPEIHLIKDIVRTLAHQSSLAPGELQELQQRALGILINHGKEN